MYFYEGEFCRDLSASHLPDMDNTKLVVWSSCYVGADNGESMAYQCVSNGAEYSIGFPGKVYQETVATFVQALFEALKTRTVFDAVETAVKKTKSEHWFRLTFNLLDDTILQPNLFYNKAGYTEVKKYAMKDGSSANSLGSYRSTYGVIHKKDCQVDAILSLKRKAMSTIDKLESDYDHVRLFAGLNHGVLKMIAVCASDSDEYVAYIDLESGECITPNAFEQLMRGENLEVI